MTFILALLGLLGLPSILTLSNDPAPGLFTSVSSARRLNCERASLEEARRARPGLMEDEKPRGDFIERQAVLCSEPVFEAGARHPQDDAILSGLSATTSGLASRIAEIMSGTTDRNWLVEVHYPRAQLGAKISFAAKSALLEDGLRVTDRLPSLAAGDIEILSLTPPLQAYPLACKRYFAADRLGDNDAVLSLLILDSRETQLHAGTCINGDWTWLQ